MFKFLADLPSDLSLSEWLMAVLVLLGCWWIYKLQKRLMDERQKEIDRLAQDNREYRERFLKILDDRFKAGSSETD